MASPFYHPLHSQIHTFTCRSVNAGVIHLTHEMQFSIANLCRLALLFAILLGVVFPIGRFFFYDRVNFNYDFSQTVEYIGSTTDIELGNVLLNSMGDLAPWHHDKFVVAECRIVGSAIHLELISASCVSPKWLDIKLNTGETCTLDVVSLTETGTFYVHGDVRLGGRVDSNRIVSILVRNESVESSVFEMHNGG